MRRVSHVVHSPRALYKIVTFLAPRTCRSVTGEVYNHSNIPWPKVCWAKIQCCFRTWISLNGKVTPFPAKLFSSILLIYH